MNQIVQVKQSNTFETARELLRQAFEIASRRPEYRKGLLVELSAKLPKELMRVSKLPFNDPCSFWRAWPYCFVRPDGEQNLWLPLNRQYKPIGWDHNGYYEYPMHVAEAWQFENDPREIGSAWRLVKNDHPYLYREGEIRGAKACAAYAERLALLLDATGPNAVTYISRLLNSLPRGRRDKL